ncbi:MAG: efflux RND transporter permease subunit [Pikeienuella sp.]|uniref:efflux RND transporter permease subunit n=1 Tax=Pikeienuella sp. TaxID=2831957 RepID=UPI00391ADE6C
MNALIRYFTRHPTAANLLLLFMLVGGLVSATNLRSQYLPDIVVERVTVSVLWPGAGPQDVDRAIVAVLDPPLLALEGVESTASTAREGRAVISVEFTEGWDMSRGTDDVKAAVDAVLNLPDTAEEPVVTRAAYRDRVTDVVIHGPADVAQLTRYAAELQTRLFRAGVTRTRIFGAEDPVIRVSTPEAMLVRHDLTLAEIAAAIRAGAESRPAGAVSEGGARLRTGETRRSAEEIGGITIRSDAGGERLLVRDVATVETEGVEKGVAYFWGENPAVTLRVDREEKGDSIAMQRLVQSHADALAAELPEGVEIRLTQIQADQITDRLNILLENGLLGLAIVVGLLFLFLSARTAFWVALGVPAAFGAAIGFMWMAGITLNMVSLFALIICLGIVVDDAIVVGEHADHLAATGLPPAVAAEEGAIRMASPVFAATITTIIAFAGITFVSGRFGSMILDVPLTVIAVLAASLLECFLILPAHMRHALAGRAREAWYDAPGRVFNRGFERFRGSVFLPLMRHAIRARYAVVAGAICAVLLSVSLFRDGTVTWRFWASPEVTTVNANIAMLPGATREDTLAQLREMQAALERVNARFAEERGVAGLDYAVAQVGGNIGWRGLSGADAKDPDQLGGLAVTLIDPDLRPYSQWVFIAAWEEEIARLPMLETMAIRHDGRGPGGDSIDVKLVGAEAETLKAAAEALKFELTKFAAVTSVEDSLAWDKTELLLTLTPKGEALGLSTESVGRDLRNRLSGIEAAEYLLDGRTATVLVSLPEAEMNADYLDRARVRAPSGAHVALSEVIETTARTGFSAVRREDGLATIRVSGDVSEDDPAAAAEVSEFLRTRLIPDIESRFDVKAELAGLAEQERDFLSDATVGFIFCVSGVYLVLAWIFGSWTRPLVIVLAIPFGIVGAIAGHHWAGLPLSLFSVVGLLGMSGIIVNDSIVLVRRADELSRLRPRLAALAEAAADRLRAVLLTTLTTVGGLAPLMFETSQQALFLKPTVVTLVWGLSFGMILVLFVTPAMIAIQHDLGSAIRSFRRMRAHLLRRRPGLGRRAA